MEFIIDKSPLDSPNKLALATQYDRTSAVDWVTDGTLITLQQEKQISFYTHTRYQPKTHITNQENEKLILQNTEQYMKM